MVSVDKAAMIWSIVIVIIAVGFAIVGSSDIGTSKVGNDGDNMDMISDGMQPILTDNTASVSISLKTDKQVYVESTKIEITGSVDTQLTDIPLTMIVSAPNGDIVTIGQLTIGEDGNFAETLNTGGPLWKYDGKYTIKMHYGKQNSKETNIIFIASGSTSDTPDAFLVDATTVAAVGERKIFSVNHNIINADVRKALMDIDCACLVVEINTRGSGLLAMDLPRNMLNTIPSMNSGDMFIVLIDGVEVDYDDVSSNSESRTIWIEFEKDASVIEVMGTMQS